MTQAKNAINKAIEITKKNGGRFSYCQVQRALKLNYFQARRIREQMEELGIINSKLFLVKE